MASIFPLHALIHVIYQRKVLAMLCKGSLCDICVNVGVVMVDAGMVLLTFSPQLSDSDAFGLAVGMCSTFYQSYYAFIC